MSTFELLSLESLESWPWDAIDAIFWSAMKDEE